jgi:hypothetical protein
LTKIAIRRRRESCQLTINKKKKKNPPNAAEHDYAVKNKDATEVSQKTSLSAKKQQTEKDAIGPS